MKEEIWKIIEDAPEYAVSNHGRVKAFSKVVKKWNGFRTIPEKVLKSRLTHDGYPRIGLYINGKQKGIYVHLLVIEAFVGPRPPSHECNHKDTNKKNNCVENLEWVLHQENQNHAIQNGLYLRGEKVKGSKLHDEEISLIRNLVSKGEVDQRKIAKMFKVSDTTISDIKLGKIWRHIQ